MGTREDVSQHSGLAMEEACEGAMGKEKGPWLCLGEHKGSGCKHNPPTVPLNCTGYACMYMYVSSCLLMRLHVCLK